jgi:hypothetical protein
MKTTVKAAALALATAQYCPAALADDARLHTRPGWELGVHASRYKYEEPGLMSLEGYRGGVSGAFTITTRSRVFLRLDLRVSHGILDYEGSGTLKDVPDWLVEARALYGRDLALGSRMTLSPYVGLGLRYLRNDLRGTTSTGAAGYVRASRYAYLPLGATLRLGIGERWALAPTLEYDVFLRGRQQSELGDTGIPGLEDATNTQTRGRGYRASLMLETDDWSFGPWVQYWHIRDSRLVTAGSVIGMEPENKTREAGLELRYRF